MDMLFFLQYISLRLRIKAGKVGEGGLQTTGDEVNSVSWVYQKERKNLN